MKKNTSFFKGKVKHATFSAVVTRADGTVENYGIVAEGFFTPFGKIKNWCKKLVTGKIGKKNGIKIYSC